MREPDVPRALELERRMREEGLEPNVITLTSLMQARARLHLGGAPRAYPSGTSTHLARRR